MQHIRHLDRDSRLQNCSETRRRCGRTRRTPSFGPQYTPSVLSISAAPGRDLELRPHSPGTSQRRCSPGAPRSPELPGAGVRTERAAVNPGSLILAAGGDGEKQGKPGDHGSRAVQLRALGSAAWRRGQRSAVARELRSPIGPAGTGSRSAARSGARHGGAGRRRAA